MEGLGIRDIVVWIFLPVALGIKLRRRRHTRLRCRAAVV